MQDAHLDRLLAHLVANLNPKQIYLFGSRTTGMARPDSDYDLMVILPDDAPRKHLSRVHAWELIKDMQVDVDVVPVRHHHFSERKDWPGTLSYEAAHHGVKLYESV